MSDIMESFFKEKRYQYYFIVAIIMALYAKTIFFDFSYMDDNILVLANKYFLQHISNILEAFRFDAYVRDWGNYYRPLLTVSFILDAQISGVSPLIYHLTNILIHITATCLLFNFFIKFGYPKDKSFFFSLVFAVHPALVQAVAWIPGRNDSLLTVFSLSSLIFLMRYCDSRNTKDYFLHLLFLCFALFTKESAISLIPVFVVYMWLLMKERIFSSKSIMLLTGWAIAIGILLFARIMFIKGSYNIPVQDKMMFVVEGMPALIQYIGKILLPFNLSTLALIADTTYVYGIISLMLLAAAFILYPPRQVNNIIFGSLWFLVFLLPTFCMPKDISHELEHRLYLPMTGFLVILGEIDLKLSKKIYYISGALLLTLFSIITFLHSNDYRDKHTFWQNALLNSPHSPIAHWGAGLNYLYDGDINKAELELKKSIALDKYHEISSHILLGMAYAEKKMFDEAENEFRTAISMRPNRDMGYMGYAGFCYSRNRIKEAAFYWKKAIEINPNNINAYKKLVLLYYKDGRLEESNRYCGILKEKWNIDFVPEDNIINFDAKNEIDLSK